MKNEMVRLTIVEAEHHNYASHYPQEKAKCSISQAYENTCPYFLLQRS